MTRFDPNTYVSVQDRINQFWADNPSGSIVTHLISDPSQFGNALVRAEVRKEAGQPFPDSTGISAEWQGQPNSQVAGTSWHEKAETSAIGRALANMGYAKSQEDRPSREEMEHVVTHTTQTPYVQPGATSGPQQRPGNGPTQPQMGLLHKLAGAISPEEDSHQWLHQQAWELFEVESLTNLTVKQTSELIDALKADAVQMGVWKS